MKRKQRLRLFEAVFIILSFVDQAVTEEPRCSSCFDCNLGILQKIGDMERKILDLTNENAKQQEMIEKMSTDGRGSVYVRWGRNVCSEDATLVYKGYVGGKYYNEPGSGSDSVCLPSDPTWSNYTDGNAGCCRGRMYGSEIHIEEPSRIFPDGIHSKDMPCAVCQSSKSTTLMIPARANCYSGWKLEYTGYIMANYKTHPGPHNHICMDSHPEYVLHGEGHKLQHLLYLIEAQCNSLPCPPYVQGRELACVVCSK